MNAPTALPRRATRGDADAIADLHSASWRDVYRDVLPARHLGAGLANERRRHWRAKLATIMPRDVVLVAGPPGELRGFVAVRVGRPGMPAYIDNLHVLAGDRRTGLGRRLLAAVARRLVAAGRRSAYLWVFRDNRDAVAFYRATCGRVTRRAFDAFARARAPLLCMAWRDLRRLGS